MFSVVKILSGCCNFKHNTQYPTGWHFGDQIKDPSSLFLSKTQYYIYIRVRRPDWS